MSEKSFSQQVDEIEADLLANLTPVIDGNPHIAVLTAMVRVIVLVAIRSDVSTAATVLLSCAQTLGDAAACMVRHQCLMN